MKITIMTLSALALFAVASAPAEARVDYRGVPAEVQSQSDRLAQANINIGSANGSQGWTAIAPSGRAVTSRQGADGRWWPSR